jgi:DNA replication and repair protein RecF
MAVLTRLRINDFRNLKSVDLHTSPGFNLLVGSNGSGKTSALEAIHVLSVGRSFRTHKLDPLVATDSSQFLLYAELAEGHRLGLQRGRGGSPTLRLDGETQTSWSDIALLLPLQVINTDSFGLLEGGGKTRRRFLDWAMFHVEHTYLADWRAYRRIVSQRNVLLKQKPKDLRQLLDAWDLDLSRLANSIQQRRATLVDKFTPLFQELVSIFLPGVPVSFEYYPGWDVSTDIWVALLSSRERDMRYGMTLLGPHRADFQVKINRHAATEVLSRGQIKMLVCALKLSMGQFIKSHYLYGSGTIYRSIYLVDDLAAELDTSNCSLVVEFLNATKDQCFFTAIEKSALSKVTELTESSGKFHVEHGKIRASNTAV